MLDDDDILELPPVPSPYREKALELLTEMLVMVEDGRIRSFEAVALRDDGYAEFFTSGSDSIFHSAGMLLYLAASRLEFIDGHEIDTN